MTREHTVTVKLKEGSGAATFCAGQRCELQLKGDDVATKWKNGDPITTADFQRLLEPAGHFEIVTKKAKSRSTQPAVSDPTEEK